MTSSEKREELFPYLKKGSKSRGINKTGIIAFMLVPLLTIFLISQFDSFGKSPAASQDPTMQPSSFDVPRTVRGAPADNLAVESQKTIVEVVVKKQNYVLYGLIGFNVFAWGSLGLYRWKKIKGPYIRGLEVCIEFIGRYIPGLVGDGRNNDIPKLAVPEVK